MRTMANYRQLKKPNFKSVAGGPLKPVFDLSVQSTYVASLFMRS